MGAAEGIAVKTVGDLKLDALLPHDVLILPDDALGKQGAQGLGRDVPAFVEAGGGFLSCAQGARCIGGGYPPASIYPLMPSICAFAADLNFLKDARTLRKGKLPEAFYKVVPAGGHPITEKISQILPADINRWKGPVDNYAMMKLGRDGQAVLIHPSFPFYPAMAAGPLGGGRAAFAGMRFIFSFPQEPEEEDLDAASDEKPKMEEDRELLLINTIRWLARPRDTNRMAVHALRRLQALKELKARQEAAISYTEGRLRADLQGVPELSKDAAFAQCSAALARAKKASPGLEWTRSLMDSLPHSQAQTARAFLKCREFEEGLRTARVRLLKLAGETRTAAYRAAGKFPKRGLPLYPRGTFHTKARVDEVAGRGQEWTEKIAERYLRELSEELHANLEVGLVCTARALGKYDTKEVSFGRDDRCRRTSRPWRFGKGRPDRLPG